ncbi:hypothetical protein AAHE18_08G039100 [Arachis hypogaea]
MKIMPIVKHHRNRNSKAMLGSGMWLKWNTSTISSSLPISSEHLFLHQHCTHDLIIPTTVTYHKCHQRMHLTHSQPPKLQSLTFHHQRPYYVYYKQHYYWISNSHLHHRC